MMFKQTIVCLGKNSSTRSSLHLSLLVLLLLWTFANTANIQASTHLSSLQSPPDQDTPAQSKEEVATLELGAPIERELASAQIHSYRIRLAQGQHALVSLEQRGIDVVVELLGTDNNLVAVFDDEIGSQGKEEIEFVAETTGVYTLAVKAKLKGVPAGSYELRFIEARAATDHDRSLQETRKLRAQSAQLYQVGKYDEAVPLAEHALTIAERLLGPDHVYVAQLVKELGDVYAAKPDFAKAKPLYERALTVLEKELKPEHPQAADAMRALGVIYVDAGEYPKADQLLSRALEMAEKTLGTEHPLVANCLTGLGMVYTRRGEFEKGEEHIRRSLIILETTLGTENITFASVLSDLSFFLNRRRDYEGANKLLQRSLAIMEKILGPEHLRLAVTLQNLGINASAKKDNATALQYYLRALAIREKAQGAEHADVAWLLNNIANSYRRKGDYVKAVETHLRAVRILEKTAGPYQPVTLLTLGGIARDYAAMGDVANAIKFQSRVDAVIETNIALNLAFGSERQKLVFLNTLSGRTNRTISLNMQFASGNADASALAALVVLQRKGRVLDAMTDTLAALRQRAGAQDRVLLAQLNETTAQLARLVLNGPQEIPPEEHQRAIKELEEKKEKLEAEISKDSAEFRAQSQPVTLEAVQAAIPTDTALVEFAAYRPFNPKAEIDSDDFGETRYVAYVVHRQGEPQGKDLGAAKVIDDAVDALRQALRDPLRRDVQQLARVVDEKVMQPVRGLLGNATQLLISPDGALNLMPFEALVDERGQYLIQRYSFTYLTSGRDLLRMQVAREAKSKPSVIANPSFGEPPPELLATTNRATKLPGLSMRRRSVTTGRDLSEVYFAALVGTAQEARSIQTLFPDSSLLTGTQATETALKQLTAPLILHIATHGFFLSEPGADQSPQRGSPAAAVVATGSIAQVTTRGSNANARSVPPADRGPQPGSPIGVVVAGGLPQSTQPSTRGISANVRIENQLLRSGLALTGANMRAGATGDDGILTALEASGLNLWGTKLVVLSACDTGLGVVHNGEGVYGLRRAFVLAGAESLVMSLWPISDYSTRTLMTNYYRNLKQGIGRGASLRTVKLDMLKRNPNLHPFYWANFIQSGEWANLDGERR